MPRCTHTVDETANHVLRIAKLAFVEMLNKTCILTRTFSFSAGAKVFTMD